MMLKSLKKSEKFRFQVFSKQCGKRKEEGILNLKEIELNPEEEKDMKNRKGMLKSLKKNVARKSDFRHLTNNVGKGKKNGLRKIEVEEGDETITMRNKE